MEDPPLLSIVTACYNRASFVAAAVESALAQDYPAVEHLIIDGGSTDGTLDVLRRYPHLRVVSEPDRGVYDAFNKGVRLARGEVIGLLNTDDYYEPNVFGEVMARFGADATLLSVSGGARIIEDGPGGVPRTLFEWSRPEECALTLHNMLWGAPMINARFFRRAAYARLGAFDESYPVAADLDFLLRAVLADLRDTTLGRVVYVYQQHGGSLTVNGDAMQSKARLERLAIFEHLLRGAALSPADRRALARSHTWESLVLLGHAGRRRRFGDALHHFFRGWRYDRRWPIDVLYTLGRQVRRSRPAAERPESAKGGVAC